jgi:uncharacterized phage protein gp47/JayE
MTLNDLVYIDSAGYHYADYPSFLSWQQEAYKAIYGADVYLEADSQDGQYVAIQAKAFYDCAVLGAAVYNSFSPATAQGIGLARIVKINGIKKLSATNSTADLTIVGSIGTTILNGVAQDTLGQKWNLPASVVIPVSGSIVVTATNQELGAINAVANTITKIYTPTLGWQSVTNILAATPGAPVEEDAQLRIRQTSSVALPSLSVFEGTKGAVRNVSGVTRAEGYENDTGSTNTDGIPAHSIAMVVEGGVTDDITQVIATHKTPGTRTYGTTSGTVYDKYGVPNTINFYRPSIVPIKVEVDITACSGYTLAYSESIIAAVADAINALAIGADVLITKLYVPANLPGTFPGTTFDIITIKIAKVGNAFGTINVPVLFNEAASCDIANVTIVVVP